MKINDLTTLEILSTDELNQVAGGSGCYYKPYGRFFGKFNRKMRKMRKDMPIAIPPGPGDVFDPGDVMPDPTL